MSEVLPTLIFASRMRRGFMQAELRLANQIKAIERRVEGGADQSCHEIPIIHVSTLPIDAADQGRYVTQAPIVGGVDEERPTKVRMDSRGSVSGLLTFELDSHRLGLHKSRLVWEREIAKLATALPVYPWAQTVRGLGPLSLGLIVAELGDPGQYATPAKVWKRMGLAVIDGKSQRRVAGGGGIEQGYSPRRRSLMYIVGENLLRQNGAGEYRTLYNERKATETGDSPLHIHRRAMRYMTKRLLLDLWREWRANNRMLPISATPSLPPDIEIAS